jgi:hypothetical protein
MVPLLTVYFTQQMTARLTFSNEQSLFCNSSVMLLHDHLLDKSYNAKICALKLFVFLGHEYLVKLVELKKNIGR